MSDMLSYVYLTVNETEVNAIPIQLDLQYQPIITTDNNLYNFNLLEQENISLIWNNQISLPQTQDIKEQETATLNLIKSEDLVNQNIIVNGIDNSLINIQPNYVFEDDKSQVQLLNQTESQHIRCQNCETVFSTKYQYQRHQCEFNASKVVLKPEVKGEDIHTVIRAKYECETCKKTFISITNLDRHKQSHISTGSNTCEHCNKTFVSESRLLTHKANHCKKSGEVTKFYRSDVAVWHCLQCDQVFSNEPNANEHVLTCISPELNIMQTHIKLEQDETREDDEKFKQVSTNLEEDSERVKVSPSVEQSKEMVTQVETSTEDENKFDTNLAKVIQMQQPTYSEFKSTNPNVEKIITETLYQCEFCNRTYASKMSVRRHQKLHNTERNYECVFCGSIFENYCDAVLHWQSRCAESADVFFLPKLVYCEYCDKGYKSHDVLYNHKNKKKHYSFKLNASDGMGANEFVLQETARLTELEIENSGGDVMANGSEGENGKKKRGRKRKYPRIEFELNVLPVGCKYQCPRCGEVFDDVKEFESHMDAQHANIYKCKLCGQVLNSAKALSVHSRAHDSLKPYVCDKCGRSYSQTSHLWQHMRFHQGIKPFACPHEGCEARYTIRPDLKDHIRKVHTRERPFKCAVCQKCFLTGSVYYQHRLIHTNDRRYGCEVCNKRFFRADALNNHRRIHTDERPYLCTICGRSFRQKGDRNKHLRTQHGTT